MTLVVLHGWGHNSTFWKSFASKFYNYNVVLLDLPGFGKEKLLSENWNISDYASWVEKTLKKLKLKDVVLIGHSFGGKIAVELDAKNPKLIKKLVLISAPVLRRPDLSTKIKMTLHKISKRVILKNSLNTSFNDEYRDAKKNKLGKVFVKSVNYDAGSMLKKINIPTLIIWGDKDRDAPLFIAKEMNKLIKNSKLEVLANTGHNVYLEKPDLLFGLINKFIENKYVE